MRPVHDWDKILKEMSSGEDSDEYDTPNIVSLKKHGPKLMEMVSNIIETNQMSPELQKANKKAKTNTSSEPVMEGFKTIQKEIKQAVEKKEAKLAESQSHNDKNPDSVRKP